MTTFGGDSETEKQRDDDNNNNRECAIRETPANAPIGRAPRKHARADFRPCAPAMSDFHPAERGQVSRPCGQVPRPLFRILTRRSPDAHQTLLLLLHSSCHTTQPEPTESPSMAPQVARLQVSGSVVMEAAKKLLRVALVGAPNAGKSTLLNRLIYSDISCVSNKVHTTRKNMLGVYTEAEAQLEFYDSPGVVTKEHVLKHHLEDSLLRDAREASERCDLIAVIVDASNLRDSKKLNRNVLSMLLKNSDKKSYLILNKIDKVKEKRLLLDIGSRLTEGHLDGRRLLEKESIHKMMERAKFSPQIIKPTSPHVIELDRRQTNDNHHQDDHLCQTHEAPTKNIVGYRNFSRVFSISALQDDGLDELRTELLHQAQPVESWPHGPDYLTNESLKDIVHSIIRGKVMDSVDHEIPYVIKYKYLQIKHDHLGSLHVHLELVAPKKYMIGKLLGRHGAVIFNIINESRDKISRCLACDVKLNIAVKSKEN